MNNVKNIQVALANINTAGDVMGASYRALNDTFRILTNEVMGLIQDNAAMRQALIEIRDEYNKVEKPLAPRSQRVHMKASAALRTTTAGADICERLRLAEEICELQVGVENMPFEQMVIAAAKMNELVPAWDKQRKAAR